MPASSPEVYAAIALSLAEADADTTPHRVVELVGEVVAHDGASLLGVQGRRSQPIAVSNDLAARAEQAQTRAGEGPCIETARHPGSVVVEDALADDRWPRWAAGVRPLGIRSALSVQLRTRAGAVGSLELYALRPAAFDPAAVAAVEVFARHAAVAVAAVDTEEGLRRAIDARHVIGQAQGILMERFDIDAERAFAVLRRYSQDRNVRLRQVAETVVAVRALPGETPGRAG